MTTLRKLLLVGALLGAGAGVGTALFALVTPGDAGAVPAAQGRGGQDQRVAAGHSAGSSGHARERRLEKELDEWRRRREVSLRQNLLPWAPGLMLQRRRPSRPDSSVGRRGVQTRMPSAGISATSGAAAG
nr:PREDICTED: ubiquinol-cytochrome-c reductase complex assembly factor 3 isoform X1 [Bos mutus]